jgi:hypothetical protein
MPEIVRTTPESVRVNFADNKSKSTIGYMIWNAATKAEAAALLEATAPGTDDELVLDSLETDHIEAGIYEGSASYITKEWKEEKQKNQQSDPDIGVVEWDFDGSGGTQQITQGLAPSKIFHTPDWNPMEFQRAINVSRTKTGWNVKGCTVKVPQMELTATVSIAPLAPDALLTYIQGLSAIQGKTNAAPWRGFAKNTVLFNYPRIKHKRTEKTTLVFSFTLGSHITVADNFKIAEIGPIEKLAHEYLWVYYVMDDESGQVLMKPKQVMVETVYLEGDFAAIGF